MPVALGQCVIFAVTTGIILSVQPPISHVSYDILVFNSIRATAR